MAGWLTRALAEAGRDTEHEPFDEQEDRSTGVGHLLDTHPPLAERVSFLRSVAGSQG